jgi:hypothetical protein
MDVTPAVVTQLVARLFPVDQRPAVSALLERYGTLAHEKEADRVRVAALKLSQGSLDKLTELIDHATRDYRDILAWAEYPGEMRQATWRLPAVEQSRIRAEDRAQYLAWLRANGAEE